jgi:hypothetical protein
MARDIFIFLFTLGVILFNWPVISIFDTALSQYFFVVWLIFIAAIYFITTYSRKGDREG